MRILILTLLLAVQVSAAPPPDFTIVALPDTQKYAKHRPDLFQSQVDWIIANRTNRNIVYVAHLGDITDDGDEKPEQWTVATNCLYRLLEAGIPLGAVAGNHDHKGGTKLYDSLLGPHVFAGRPWYGGHLGTDYRNHYDLFTVGNLDFIVLHLDFNYDKLDYRAADAWAPGILASNAHRRAIVITHDLLSVKGEFDPRGKAIYDNLKSHTNLFLMHGGHNHAEAQRADTDNGHTIYSILSDYQSWTNGGNGYLRLYRFSPAKNIIHVQSYSPAINHYRTGPTSEFEIPYRMNPDAPLPDLPPFENRHTILNINAKPQSMSPPVPNPSPLALHLRVLRDDGIAVDRNGTGIYTNNLPATCTATTCAVKTIGGADESNWQTATSPASYRRPGTNVVTVEVHQSKPDSSDLRFDLELTEITK